MAHLPGYNWCGPGTVIEEADVPVNQLDNYCREHDINYSKSRDKISTSEADKKLIQQAQSESGLSA